MTPIGYSRYKGEEAAELMRAIYLDWRLYVKLVAKERVGSKGRKWYDEARTPYQRVLARADVDEAKKGNLRELYRTLNPVALRRWIE